MPAHFIDITEVAAAGGSVRFYQVGTLIQATVYYNDAATTILSQPISIDTAGKPVYPVYSISPVRAVFFDPNGAQVLDTERANGERAEITSLVNDSWPESSTVNAAFSALAASLGSTDGNTSPGFSGAIGRTIKSRLQEEINVKDFGAIGDGASLNDLAFANAMFYAATVGRTSVLRVPAGVYLFNSPLSNPSAATNSVTIKGDAKNATTLKANGFTTQNFISNLSLSFELSLQSISISNSSTSTGTAITAQLFPKSFFYDMEITGFRTGISFDGICMLVNVTTDSDATSSGFKFKDASTALFCTATAGSGAPIRIPISAGGSWVNIIACEFIGTTHTGITFDTGNAVAGGFIAGNRTGTNTTLITATAGTRGLPGVRVIGTYSQAQKISENAASTDIITNPSAGVLTLNLSGSRYVKSTLAAATAITFNTATAPTHDDIFTIVLQNSTGGGFAITAGTGVTLQAGGFTVGATSQSIIHMQYDSNAAQLLQVTAPLVTAVI